MRRKKYYNNKRGKTNRKTSYFLTGSREKTLNGEANLSHIFSDNFVKATIFAGTFTEIEIKDDFAYATKSELTLSLFV